MRFGDSGMSALVGSFGYSGRGGLNWAGWGRGMALVHVRGKCM